MIFGDAVNLINSITKRPDKSDDVKAAINRTIGNFATLGTFAHDLSEPAAIAISGSLYVQSLDLTIAPFTRYRKMKYLRPSGYTKYLKQRDSSRIFVGGEEMRDVWYQSGTNIIFKLCNLQSSMLVGYYQYHAALVADADTDWMLDLMWPAVHACVLADIFDEIGDDASAQRYAKRWPVLFEAYRNDLKDGVSYA